MEPNDRTARRTLAQLCTELRDVRMAAARLGRLAELEAALAEMARERSPEKFVRGHSILTDLIDVPRGPVRIPGLGSGEPVEGGYVCPLGMCSRAVEREPSGRLPVCDVLQAPMPRI